jgi:pimeloyl-ACP methyl ester carboxylesterase
MVQQILGQAPPKFALAGHSMGGWLCLEVMRRAPERVTQLCLLNTTARGDSPEKLRKREQAIFRVENGEFAAVAKEIADLFIFNPSTKPQVEKMFLKEGKDVFIQQERAMIDRQECLSILPTIKCPTLIIHAARDKNFSLEEHQELAELIPNSMLAIVEDSGHMSPMEMPQAVTALMRFWLTYLHK